MCLEAQGHESAQGLEKLKGLFVFFFFGCAVWLMGTLVPQPGIEPGPQQWMC